MPLTPEENSKIFWEVVYSMWFWLTFPSFVLFSGLACLRIAYLYITTGQPF
jgi:hypothetical protein